MSFLKFLMFSYFYEVFFWGLDLKKQIAEMCGLQTGLKIYFGKFPFLIDRLFSYFTVQGPCHHVIIYYK